MGSDEIDVLNDDEPKPISLVDAQRLQELLDTMNVPKKRKTDLRWLGRNLGINNSTHPNFEEAIELVRRWMRS